MPRPLALALAAALGPVSGLLLPGAPVAWVVVMALGVFVLVRLSAERWPALAIAAVMPVLSAVALLLQMDADRVADAFAGGVAGAVLAMGVLVPAVGGAAWLGTRFRPADPAGRGPAGSTRSGPGRADVPLALAAVAGNLGWFVLSTFDLAQPLLTGCLLFVLTRYSRERWWALAAVGVIPVATGFLLGLARAPHDDVRFTPARVVEVVLLALLYVAPGVVACRAAAFRRLRPAADAGSGPVGA